MKIEEWVDRSRGKLRADVAHQRLVAMGYMDRALRAFGGAPTYALTDNEKTVSVELRPSHEMRHACAD